MFRKLHGCGPEGTVNSWGQIICMSRPEASLRQPAFPHGIHGNGVAPAQRQRPPSSESGDDNHRHPRHPRAQWLCSALQSPTQGDPSADNTVPVTLLSPLAGANTDLLSQGKPCSSPRLTCGLCRESCLESAMAQDLPLAKPHRFYELLASGTDDSL